MMTRYHGTISFYACTCDRYLLKMENHYTCVAVTALLEYLNLPECLSRKSYVIK